MEAYTSTLGQLTDSLTHLSAYCSCIHFEACPRVPDLLQILAFLMMRVYKLFLFICIKSVVKGQVGKRERRGTKDLEKSLQSKYITRTYKKTSHTTLNFLYKL